MTTRIPPHLPERLTIAFPIWLLHDTAPGGRYHDLDKVVREHVERGFNCIRFDDGAGLIHDGRGRLRGPATVSEPYPGFTRNIRQLWCTGPGGRCDPFERLIALLEAAKKYDCFVILSSWFYLHTFWYCDEELNRELFAVPPHERFGYFARALDYLLAEIRKRGLIDRVAFAEILNEADGLPFINGYDKENHCSVGELNRFRAEHEQGLAFLRERHPDILFACDTYTPYTDTELLPRNLLVWNFHSYYLWKIYGLLEGDLLRKDTDLNTPARIELAARYMRENPAPVEAVRASRAGKFPAAEDWLRRVWLYSNLDPAKLPELDRVMAAEFDQSTAYYRKRLSENVEFACRLRDELFPGTPLVMGEGVSYCGSNFIRWEETHEAYWEFLEFAAAEYRRRGLWGCVVRTCCGPEDPCWEPRAENLLKLNRLFLHGPEQQS